MPNLLSRLRSNSASTSQPQPAEEKLPTYHAATARAPRRAPTWTAEDGAPPQLGDTHNELIFRAFPKGIEDELSDHALMICDGDVPLYTLNLDPPDTQPNYTLTLHKGSDTSAAMVAGASYKMGGKDFRITLNPNDPEPAWIEHKTSKTARTLDLPEGPRSFVIKNTTDVKLGCSGNSVFDQKVVDAKTDEMCAVFLWNTEKTSFTHERKRATVRWCIDLSRDEKMALLMALMGWKERTRGKTPRGFFGNVSGVGWSVSGTYYG